LAFLDEAIALAKQTPYRFHLMRCLHLAGGLLRTLARRDEARAALEQAHALAKSIGAAPLAATIAADRESLERAPVIAPVQTDEVGPEVTAATHLHVLGAFRVLDAKGNDVTPGGIPGKAVRILVAAGRALHSEELADRLWDEPVAPVQVRARLR